MHNKKIYLDDPNIGTLEKQYLNKAVDSRFVSTAGPFVLEFEEVFAKFLHVKNRIRLGREVNRSGHEQEPQKQNN